MIYYYYYFTFLHGFFVLYSTLLLINEDMFNFMSNKNIDFHTPFWATVKLTILMMIMSVIQVSI